MNRFITLVISLLLLIGFITSCSGDVKPTEATPSQQSLSSVSECTDYEGYEFRILTIGSLGGEHWAEFEFFSTADTEENSLGGAVTARDSEVESLHNIKISYIEKSSIIDYARGALLAGNDDFDLLSLSLTSAAELAKEAMLANLMDYDDILKLEEDHWDQSANYSLDIKGHLYFAPSDLTLNDKQSTWAVYVNNSMLSEYPQLTEGYENGIYSMVKRGEWTLERMHNMVKAVSVDNGDGIRDMSDNYGHYGETFSFQSLVAGCGEIGIRKDDNGEFKYVIPSDLSKTAQDHALIHDIVYNKENSILSGMLHNYVNDVWIDGPTTMLEDNRLLFTITGVNRSRLCSKVKADLSIIPLPKADESQIGYYNLMNGYSNCVAIPYNSPDKVRTCEILETLTYIASKTTYQAYKDTFLKSDYLSKEQNDKLFELVFGSRVYDIGDIYNINGVHFGGTVALSKIDDVEDLEAYLYKQKSRNEKALEKFLLEMEDVFKKTKRYN